MWYPWSSKIVIFLMLTGFDLKYSILFVNISIRPTSSDLFAGVQWVKKGNPSVSTARCLLIPLVALYRQKPFDSTLALQVFLTAWESTIIKVVHFLFFYLFARGLMKKCHQFLNTTCRSPLFVMPIDC